MSLVYMRQFRCNHCQYEGPEFFFDPDNHDGPITPFYRCPQCLESDISGPTTDQHPIVTKFELRTELFRKNVIPRLSSLH